MSKLYLYGITRPREIRKRLTGDGVFLVTADDRAALCELMEVIQEILRRSAGTLDGVAGVTDWVDLTCLMCGEGARARQCGRRLMLEGQSNIRESCGRLVCGRCGGTVAPGARGRQYQY